MNQLISEFFYEGIRRIIPGLVVVALFCHKEVEIFFPNNRDVAFAVCLLILAWMLGVVIDQIVHLFIRLVWSLCGGRQSVAWLRKILKIEGDLKNKRDKISKIKNDEEAREDRRYRSLIFAEKAMCRNLTFIFLWASIVTYTAQHPDYSIARFLRSEFQPPEPYVGFDWSFQYLCIAFFAYLLAWLYAMATDLALDSNLPPRNFTIKRAGLANLDFAGKLIGQSSPDNPRVIIYKTEEGQYVVMRRRDSQEFDADHDTSPENIVTWLKNLDGGGITCDAKNAIDMAAAEDEGFKSFWTEHIS